MGERDMSGLGHKQHGESIEEGWIYKEKTIGGREYSLRGLGNCSGCNIGQRHAVELAKGISWRMIFRASTFWVPDLLYYC